MKIIYEEGDIRGGLKIGFSHGAFLLATYSDKKGKEYFFRVSMSTGLFDKRLTKKQVVDLMNTRDYKVWQ